LNKIPADQDIVERSVRRVDSDLRVERNSKVGVVELLRAESPSDGPLVERDEDSVVCCHSWWFDLSNCRY
jgi:hypothetical protein